MFASRRALATATRFRLAGGRSIAAPLARFSSTEAAASAPAPEAQSTTATTKAAPAGASTPITKARTTTTFSKPRAIPTRAKAPIPPRPAPAPKVAPPATVASVPSHLIWNPEAAPPSTSTPKETVEDINWEKSYYGLGTSPVTPEQFRILTEQIDVDDIMIKPDGIIYMTEIKYRRKLNEAFGPMGWGIVPRGEAIVGTNIVTREYALIVNGCFVSQAQGVNNFFGPESIPTAVEGCKSNALMRCCKDLGISSELWDPRFIRWYTKHFIVSEWVENANTKKKRRWYYKRGEELEVPYPYKISGV